MSQWSGEEIAARVRQILLEARTKNISYFESIMLSALEINFVWLTFLVVYPPQGILHEPLVQCRQPQILHNIFKVRRLSLRVVTCDYFYPLFPEPNTNFKASKIQEVKGVQGFPWSQTWRPVALHFAVSACRRFLLHVYILKHINRIFPVGRESFLKFYFWSCIFSIEKTIWSEDIRWNKWGGKS